MTTGFMHMTTRLSHDEILHLHMLFTPVRLNKISTSLRYLSLKTRRIYEDRGKEILIKYEEFKIYIACKAHCHDVVYFQSPLLDLIAKSHP